MTNVGDESNSRKVDELNAKVEMLMRQLALREEKDSGRLSSHSSKSYHGTSLSEKKSNEIENELSYRRPTTNSFLSLTTSNKAAKSIVKLTADKIKKSVNNFTSKQNEIEYESTDDEKDLELARLD